MRKLAAALIAILLAVALHSVAMSLWHGEHAAPFHSGKAMISCPMGYICPVSPAALRLAFTASSPTGFSEIAKVFMILAAVLAAYLIERYRYRTPAYVPLPTSPPGLRSIFKRE